MFQVEVYLRGRRAAMVEGMSIREASRMFRLHRDTVRKMLAYSVPPGYPRQTPLRRPKKQRHTAQRIFQRLRDEHDFPGQYAIVKDYVRESRRQAREMFVPLSNPPGHAQCDFGEAGVVIGGVKQKPHLGGLELKLSDNKLQPAPDRPSLLAEGKSLQTSRLLSARV